MFRSLLKRIYLPVNNKKSPVKYKKLKVLGGLVGVFVGDALGVPVEFQERWELKSAPIKEMEGYGTYYQIPGTWSDDSSLTLCLVDSLLSGYDIDNIGAKFCDWYYRKLWTPHGIVFDVGGTTRVALKKMNTGTSAKSSGLTDENSNGNGSLMRILPLAFYLENYEDDKFQIIEEVSGVTHAHIRSKIACSIYVEVAINLLKGCSPLEAYAKMIPKIKLYYTEKGYEDELIYFNRILNDNIYDLKENEINSGGYVIDTLEASLWCFLTSKTYNETVLSAINLGGDTDTTGAVAGGLAGIQYGLEGIPNEWREGIARKDDINHLLSMFYDSLYS